MALEASFGILGEYTHVASKIHIMLRSLRTVIERPFLCTAQDLTTLVVAARPGEGSLGGGTAYGRATFDLLFVVTCILPSSPVLAPFVKSIMKTRDLQSRCHCHCVGFSLDASFCVGRPVNPERAGQSGVEILRKADLNECKT